MVWPAVSNAPEDGTRKREVSRLLIVRLGSMGDVVHTMPAVAMLRQSFPKAKLGWIIEERWAELLCALSHPRTGPLSQERPLVDRVHTVNTFSWRSSVFSVQTLEQVAVAISELRAPQYEVAVDFQGAARSALLARWSKAPVVYGFAQPRENVASMFYTRQWRAQGRHVVEQNISLAGAAAGAQLCRTDIVFPQDSLANRKIENWLAENRIRDFAVLNPGAGWGAKQWPAARYASVAIRLAQNGLRSVVNYGPGEDGLATTVENSSHGTARALQCSIAELIALTRKAHLFIGGDTGPLHLAAASGIPVVAIFGPTDPARNGPFQGRNIVLQSPTSSISYSRRAQPDDGLLEISVDEVVAAAQQLLRGQSS